MHIPSLLVDAFAHAMAADFAVTDIVFREGMPIVLKGAGNMVTPMRDVTIDRAQMDQMLQEISRDYSWIIRHYGQLEARYEIDFKSDASNSAENKSLRVTGLTYEGGKRLSVIMRVNADDAWPIEQLCLPEVAERAIRDLKSGGLLLVAGPMAAGKSTTMYAAVHLLNSLVPQTILTIEDPIETRLDSGRGLIIQREVSPYGREPIGHSTNYRHDETSDDQRGPPRVAAGDVPDFITGVRGAMRQALNGMLIMEIRDSDTAEAALRAAEAGLWVIAGIHASESVGALDRLVNFAPADQRLDRARLLERRLHAVLFQKLVPNTDKTASVLAVEALYPKASGQQKDLAPFVDAFQKNEIASLQRLLDNSDAQPEGQQCVLSLNRSLFTLTLGEKITRDAAFAASYDLHGLKELFKRHDSAVK